jgi:hypothetical protein
VQNRLDKPLGPWSETWFDFVRPSVLAMALLGAIGAAGAAGAQERQTEGSAASPLALEIVVPLQAPPQQSMPDSGYVGERLAGIAHIDIARARALALEARSGEVVSQMLYRHAGGSGIRYAFDIRGEGATYQVGVDAADGTILENYRVH